MTRVTDHWKRIAYFLEAEEVKANFGAIDDALEKPDLVLDAWVVEHRAKGPSVGAMPDVGVGAVIGVWEPPL